MTTTLKVISISFALCVWPAIAGEAKNDFDPGIDFSQFKTFAFIGGIDIEKSGWLDEPDVHERFKNFISGALEARGLAEVPLDQEHSLAVRFWVARRQKQEVTVVDYGPTMAWGGYAPYWGGAWGYAYEEYVVHNYIHGTMVVDLIDPTTKELVWRTFVRQKIEDRTKAYVEAKKNLYRAVSIWPPSADEKEKMRRARAKLEAKYK